MADVLSATASVIALASAALQSTQSLYETINRFKSHDRVSRRLRSELEDLLGVLAPTAELTYSDGCILELLETPIFRCSQLCSGFRHSMEAFSQGTSISSRDWTRMTFMDDDIDSFINTVSSYRSTITIGLIVINLRTTNVSRRALQDYGEMIQDAAYNVQANLRRIKRRQLQIISENTNVSDVAVDVNDEKEMTRECLRVCEDVRSYIECRASRESCQIRGWSQEALGNEMGTVSEAQTLTSQALKRSRDGLAQTVDHLQRHLETLVSNNSEKGGNVMLQIQEDIRTSNQCLEVCRLASEVCCESLNNTRDMTADKDSDEARVTTLKDLLDIKKATSQHNSAQILGSMTEEALRNITNRRCSIESSSPDSSFVKANSTNSLSAKIQQSKYPGKGFRAIQAASTSDEALLMECKKKVPCENCDRITWLEPGRGNRVDPPPDTVALVVNLISARGALRIYDQHGSYVDGVGTAEAGNLMIIPWDMDWWFYVSGYLTVGLVFGN